MKQLPDCALFLATVRENQPKSARHYKSWLSYLNQVRDRSLITGEGGLVQRRGGSDIFVLEKRGGAKIFVQYKYIPARRDPAVP